VNRRKYTTGVPLLGGGRGGLRTLLSITYIDLNIKIVNYNKKRI
jgi:hypothetical protein